MRSKSLATIVFIAALLLQTAPGFGQTPAVAEANDLFVAGKWEAAAQAYDALSKADPSQAPYWFRLGYSLHSLGKYQQAVEALQKAVSVGNRPQAMYALATSYALLKDTDHAFEWLTKAVENNLPQPRQIIVNQNLAGLRDDPRYQTLSALIEKKARVCMNIPEYRQFDFWIGDWDVLNPPGQKVGLSKIVLLQDGCIVEENWTSLGGGTGQSFNFYNPVTKKWHQSYMDSSAGNWMMDGEYKENSLRYEGTIFTPTGKTLVRMTFSNLGPDKVRQTAETSSDEGRTWTQTWNGLYVRKK